MTCEGSVCSVEAGSSYGCDYAGVGEDAFPNCTLWVGYLFGLAYVSFVGACGGAVAVAYDVGSMPSLVTAGCY